MPLLIWLRIRSTDRSHSGPHLSTDPAIAGRLEELDTLNTTLCCIRVSQKKSMVNRKLRPAQLLERLVPSRTWIASDLLEDLDDGIIRRLGVVATVEEERVALGSPRIL